MLLFGALTVHASLHNATGRMRLSVDFRYQCEGEPASDLVLKPHFERLSWEEIYAGWKSDELKYYWRDLDFPVVPYDRTPFEASEPDVDEIKEAHHLRALAQAAPRGDGARAGPPRLIRPRSRSAAGDAGRDADHGRAVRNVLQHHRVRADARVRSDAHLPQHLCSPLPICALEPIVGPTSSGPISPTVTNGNSTAPE